jgi:hypothetical protein
MVKTISHFERTAIMEKIRYRCSTSISERAECTGRLEPFVTVMAYPFREGCPRAQFSWETAKRIADAGGTFNLA